MLLRMSTLLLRTLREDPADAEVPSHRLLLRAGYVRRAAPGGYTWLPLGKLVLDRVTEVIRQEMTAIGDQEVHFPALLPAEPYRTSGRWTEYGDDIFTLADRRGAEHLLAPTHEELAALLVKDLVTSYRDFPVTLFQIQTKFRDEARPRAGLLRGREFLMKDAYSFDLDESGLAAAYDRHRAAYQRIFTRLGLEHTVVHAVSGAMGGSASEEFLAAAEVGEDTYVGCTACDYAANTEAVTTPAPAASDPDAPPAAEVHDTPETPTIASLVDLANARRLAGRADWTAADTLKNVVLAVRRPGAEQPELLVVGLPGDREVDLKRVAAALAPSSVAVFDAWDAHPELVRGYLGPQILAKLGVRYLVDPRVAPGTAWLTGANEPGRHATDVVCGRDFTPDGTIEAAEVRPGDPCPACHAGELTTRRGIEIGHIFQLGRRYTDAFTVDVLGPRGKPVRPTMGCYGIGVSRAVAAIAEQHHDQRGLVWPAAVAPCDVHLIAAGKGPQLDAALELGGRLAAAGLRVLVDDRTGVSAGVKFTDAELIGIPRAVVVGRRLAEGYAELRDRATDERLEVPVDGLVEHLVDVTNARRGVVTT
ncbi:proline--tRNA ligase [Micromonospora endolithica]|uniref:Proline--tRNA ligase n=1 Tax=Micromonospora endolithica TaxID=230091 RepID=A0A3A9ZGA8_9ACTN|nr:proline--tRNA ligase [Micromonospora endolithica]RKN46367.1 proline--tRNA ligase [Micromonospora endolithica]TWJ24896.1 prolyl-tRNA synthetase [Micromonospora endolithica]